MKISLGYEYETQYINIVQKKEKIIYNGDDQLLKRFYIGPGYTFYMYADEFSSGTLFDKNKKTPFLNNLRLLNKGTGIYKHLTIQTLCQNKYDFVQIPNDQNLQTEFFKHCEFVVTYPDPQDIKREDFIKHIVSYCQKGIKQILEFYNEFDVCKITRSYPDTKFHMDIQFPYRYILTNNKHPELALLTVDDPKNISTHFKFVVQCTFGVSIYDCKYALTCLTKEFIKCGGPKSYDIINKINDISSMILKVLPKDEDKDLIENYLFIFLYSFITKDYRKLKALFIIRHLLSDIASKVLSRKIIQQIYFIIQNLNDAKKISKDIRTYFYNIHYIPLPKTMQKERQRVIDVTIFDVKDDKMILIEFRGLKIILEKYFKTKSVLHLNDILINPKKRRLLQ